MALMLLAKGGTSRMLQIDSKGAWVAAESLASE